MMNKDIKNLFICLMTISFCLSPSLQHSSQNSFDVFKDGKYVFDWSINEVDQSIQVSLDVETIGWIGLGISTQGYMANSDVIMCYYSNTSNKGICVDGWSDSRNAPPSDVSLGGSDNLLSVTGSVTDGRTNISFSRKLNTGDSKDLSIEKGKEMNVIFSYRNNGNPDTENGNFLQHSRFASKKIVLYKDTDSTDSSNSSNQTSGDSWKINIKFNSYPVPSSDTTYMCKSYDINTLVSEQTKKSKTLTYHAFTFEPIVDNENLVHHMILYGCNAPNVQIPTDYFSCVSMPDGCEVFIWGWAPGTDTFNLPEQAGVVWGTYDTSKVVLQIHYDNQNNLSDIKDSSGANISYTTKLRKYDSGVMILGHPHGVFEIPPGEEAYDIEGQCQSSCTNKLTDNITLFAYAFHGHNFLKKISSSFKKSDGSQDFSWIENDYSFDHQRIYILDQPIQVNKGFQATTTCTYNTIGETEPVKSGATTSEEMCYNFVFYYPRENGISRCFLVQNNGICPTNNKIERELDLSESSEFVQKISKFILALVISIIFI